MSTPVAFISPGAELQALAHTGMAPQGKIGAGLADRAGESAFGNVLQAQLAELDRSLKSAQTQSLRLAAGQVDSLHHLMLEIEQARIGFQLALQVRNRLMEGWQDLQRMQL
jgi:flagellar hook-basal body complex protein FliE